MADPSSPESVLTDERRLMLCRIFGTSVTQVVCSVAQSISPFLFVKWLEIMLPQRDMGFWSSDASAMQFVVALIVANVAFLGVGLAMNDFVYTAQLSIENVVLLAVWKSIGSDVAIDNLSPKLEAVWMHASRFVGCTRRMIENFVSAFTCSIFLFVASPEVGAVLFVFLVVFNIGLMFPYGRVSGRIDAANIDCKGNVSTQLQKRVRFNRTVTMSGREDLEARRLLRSAEGT